MGGRGSYKMDLKQRFNKAFEFNSILSIKTSLKSEFISIKLLEGGFYPEGVGELKTRVYLHLVDGLITGGGIVCGSLRYSDNYLTFDCTKPK